MDRMIYLSMSGAKTMMERQEVLANNLANVSTVGFRAQLHAFRSVPLEGDELRSFAADPVWDERERAGVVVVCAAGNGI